jgi:hypothetical protein
MSTRRGGLRALAAGALAAASLASPGTPLAADGRREISQASVLAAGGFPFVIAQSGSYVLTSDLTPPDNVFGIQIDTDDVNIDLNGFAIRGNLVCTPGSCTGTGPSAGVSVPASPLTNGRRCSVRNGTIAGINGSAIVLRDEAFVDAVSVTNTFFHAIILGPRSLATRNRITSTGRSGLFLGAGSGYGENVIAMTGQFFTFGSVNGGKPVGGNVCDDGRCPGARRFYLTQTPVNGAAASTACDAGFHMASRYELLDVTGLRYDAARGYELPVPSDQGQGPPQSLLGWLRTGTPPSFTAIVGTGNCSAWSVTNGQGTIAELNANWDLFHDTGWVYALSTCSSSNRVWCVEDD